jgi:hypothetical protein
VSNHDAIKRIQEKLRYTLSKIAECPDDERANFYRRLDCDAFAMAIAALEYAQQMAEYEASQL